MATISTVRSDITSDILPRTDMNSTVERCIRDAYLAIAGKVPFEDLQVGPTTIACVIGQQSYALGTILSATPLAGIISIRVERSANTGVIRLKRDHVRNYDAMATPANSFPVKYARWSSNIELWPPPDNTYNMKIRYWRKPVIDGTIANTTLLVPDDWLELIKWEAVYRLYTILNRPIDAMGLITPSQLPRMGSTKKTIFHDIGIIPRLWNDLLLTISQRESIDEDFGINPVVRQYTHA